MRPLGRSRNTCASALAVSRGICAPGCGESGAATAAAEGSGRARLLQIPVPLHSNEVMRAPLVPLIPDVRAIFAR